MRDGLIRYTEETSSSGATVMHVCQVHGVGRIDWQREAHEYSERVVFST